MIRNRYTVDRVANYWRISDTHDPTNRSKYLTRKTDAETEARAANKLWRELREETLLS